MQTIIAMQKGMIPLKIVPTGTPVTPERKKTSIPTGGVTNPISINIISITPNQIGSNPSASMAGYMMGIVSMTQDMMSRNIPRMM